MTEYPKMTASEVEELQSMMDWNIAAAAGSTTSFASTAAAASS